MAATAWPRPQRRATSAIFARLAPEATQADTGCAPTPAEICHVPGAPVQAADGEAIPSRGERVSEQQITASSRSSGPPAGQLERSANDFSQPVAVVTRHPQQQSVWGLKNVSRARWSFSKSIDPRPTELLPGQSVTLESGLHINFGRLEGEVRL